MKRLALVALILLAACGSAPEPVADGPRLPAETAARFRDDNGPGREAAFSADGALIQALKKPEDVSYVGFSPDGNRLVASGGDGTVTLWKPRSGKV